MCGGCSDVAQAQVVYLDHYQLCYDRLWYLVITCGVCFYRFVLNMGQISLSTSVDIAVLLQSTSVLVQHISVILATMISRD